RHQPGRYEPRAPADPQRLRRRPGRGSGCNWRHGGWEPTTQVVLLKLWKWHCPGDRARWRFDLATHRGSPEWARAFDMAGIAAYCHLPTIAAARRRVGGDLLLSAGHL